MVGLRVKTESFCKRCEICHQRDLFNEITNKCLRCGNISLFSLRKLTNVKIRLPRFLTKTDKPKKLFDIIKEVFFWSSVLPYILLFFTESIDLVLSSNIAFLVIGFFITIFGKLRGEPVSKIVVASLFACGLVILIAIVFVVFYFFPPPPPPCCEDF